MPIDYYDYLVTLVRRQDQIRRETPDVQAPACASSAISDSHETPPSVPNGGDSGQLTIAVRAVVRTGS
jgi:hypothetical protein